MAPKLEVSAQRILFFTKVMLTFLVISILIFLNYLDLQESNRNRAYLCMLRDTYDLAHKSRLEFTEYELERISWLNKAKPALQRKHSGSRVTLVNILNDYGASIGVETKGSGNNPNNIVLMVRPKEDPPQKTISAGGLQDVVVIGYSGSRSDGNVTMALDSFKKYESDENVYLLTSIDSVMLVRRLDSLLLDCEEQAIKATPATDSTAPASPDGTRGGVRDISGTGGTDPFHAATQKEKLFKTYQAFDGLFLHNDNIYISVRNARPGRRARQYAQDANAYGGQGSPGSSGVDAYDITIPAQIDSVVFPSTLRFAGLDTAIVRGLAHNDSKQEELANLYGPYDLNFIDNLSTEVFNKNNEAISILGFDISRKWFPIGMFMILVIMYTMLYKTIRQAALQSTKIISGFEAGEALDFLIDNKWVRFFIWVLTPVFLLFLILYSTLIRYSIAVYTGLILAGVLCFFLGWISYKRSLRL